MLMRLIFISAFYCFKFHLIKKGAQCRDIYGALTNLCIFSVTMYNTSKRENWLTGEERKRKKQKPTTDLCIFLNQS